MLSGRGHGDHVEVEALTTDELADLVDQIARRAARRARCRRSTASVARSSSRRTISAVSTGWVGTSMTG